MTEAVKARWRELSGNVLSERGFVALYVLGYVVGVVGLALTVGGWIAWLIVVGAAAVPAVMHQLWTIRREQLAATQAVDRALSGRGHASMGAAPEPLGSMPPPVPPAY